MSGRPHRDTAPRSFDDERATIGAFIVSAAPGMIHTVPNLNFYAVEDDWLAIVFGAIAR
jgi:hypothetical protein